jgi:putative modified peptide
MSLDAVSDLVERYLNDAAFRTSFARDPEAAVAAEGFTLDEAELAALHSMCISEGGDQPLRSRVTRYSFGS